MPTVRLTDITVKSLKSPAAGQVTYWDETLKGFGLRISQGGTKTFTVVHGERRERTTIGRYPTISLQDARGEAKRLIAERTLSKNRPTRIRFGDALDLFVETHLKVRNKPTTAASAERRLRKHFLPVLQRDYLEDISPARVATVVDRILAAGAPSEANHAKVALGTFFSWAIARHYALISPCRGGLPARTVARDRLLSDGEFVGIWRLAESTFGTLTRLLFLTGQRRNQIASLRAEFIDYRGRTMTWPASLMKGNKPHTIPYGDMTAALLDALPKSGLLFPARGHEDVPFSGFSKGKTALDRLCPIAPWSLHDARRFFSSTMARLGVALHLTERLLSHSGVISGVAAIYNRYQFADELRGAVTQYEAHLNRLVSDPCL